MGFKHDDMKKNTYLGLATPLVLITYSVLGLVTPKKMK